LLYNYYETFLLVPYEGLLYMSKEQYKDFSDDNNLLGSTRFGICRMKVGS